MCVSDGTTRVATKSFLVHLVATRRAVFTNRIDTFVAGFVKKTKSPRMSGVDHLDDLVALGKSRLDDQR